MPTVEMPQLGESVTEGTILRWLKQPGEPVALDDPLCEIETEKVTAELPSPFAGTMGRLLVPQGETVDVGVALCEIVAAGALSPPATGPSAWTGGPMAIPPDERSPEAAAAAVAQPAPGEAVRTPAPSGPARTMRPERRERFYSPAVLRLAEEHAVDLAAIQGTGAGGRVTRRDVEQSISRSAATVSAPPAATRPGAGGEYEVVPLSATRRTIASHLTRSNLEAPQAWTMVEADVSGLVAVRARAKERAAGEEGVDLTLLPYFTASVVESLRQFPALNARWEDEELRRYRTQNVGIAVAAEHGLVVPVIHNAGDYTVIGLARKIGELAARARERQLRVEDIQGGTFTVNNTGAFGSIASKPIVNTPEVAIVTMERVVRRPVVVDGEAIAIRSMVNVCLSFDHRALDGHEAGAFLADLRTRLEAWS